MWGYLCWKFLEGFSEKTTFELRPEWHEGSRMWVWRAVEIASAKALG